MKRLLTALSVAIFACATLALAQDSTVTLPKQSNKSSTTGEPAPSADVAAQLLRQNRNASQPIVSWHTEPGQTLRLTPNTLAAGCYTMRIYRVKRSERLQDGDTGRRGYSTCEPGGNFQVRTATAVGPPSSK